MDKIYLLTLPKLAAALMLFLFACKNILNPSTSLFEIILYDWFDILLTGGTIYYLLKSLFKESTLEKKAPLTALLLFFIGIFLFFGDIKLIMGLFHHDFSVFKEVYLQIFIASVWVLPALLITSLIEYAMTIS